MAIRLQWLQSRSALILTAARLPLSLAHQLGLPLASVQPQSIPLCRTGHGALHGAPADDYARSYGKQYGRQEKPRCQLVVYQT